MDDLVFLQVVSHDKYFLWMCEVQITNFRKFGISNKMQILVWYKPGSKYLDDWLNLNMKYPEVKFFFYKDEGVDLKLYIPLLRPHTLKKHFKIHPELQEKVIFYHDADIIFNFLPDFNLLVQGDVCWQSDCSHYLDYDYLHRKELEGKIPNNEAIKLLASIGNVSVETIKEYTGKTGGAQCILKNIDSSFWEDVERMCTEIRKKFSYSQPKSINKRYFKDENAGFQSWCADMIALNLALWNRGIKTDVTKELDFSWATDTYETFLKKPILHMAGVVNSKNNIFYKGEWIKKSPIGQHLPIVSTSATRAYVELINNI